MRTDQWSSYVALGLSALAIAGAILFGGCSQHAMVSTTVAELASVPLLAFGLWLAAGRDFSGFVWPTVLLAAGVAICAAQLIPLPIGLWRALPGRQAAFDAMTAAGVHPAFLPASLNPGATARSLASLIPGAAVFFGVAALDWPLRRLLTWFLLGLGAVSAAVGLLQSTSTMDSFYTITNPDAAVGFFANRDHLAALLYALLPFAAALGGEGLRARRAESRGAVVCAAAFGLVFFLGVAATGSLSGLALCVVALIGCGPLLLRGRAGAGRVRAWAPALLLVGAIVALLFLQFSRIGVLDRLQVQASNVDEGRFAITSTTLGAAAAYFPLGSGLGTFVPIYAAAEPVATLSTEYWNHAHNDWAEIWLEGGLPIAAVIVGFLVWSGRAALRAWKSTTGAGAGEFALPWAGFIAIGLLLIHSTADYPLRTCAIMAVFGFACAMLVIPPPAADA